jgi:hypothetical protein
MKNHTAILYLFVVIFSAFGCSDDKSSGSEDDVNSGVLNINGEDHPVVITGTWDILESSVCDAPQVGSIFLSMEGDINERPFILSLLLNFDGVNLPSMPMQMHDHSYQCSDGVRAFESEIRLVVDSAGMAKEFVSIEGFTVLNGDLVGTVIPLQGEFDQLRFTDEEESFVVSGSFLEDVFFTDSTVGKRFTP